MSETYFPTFKRWSEIRWREVLKAQFSRGFNWRRRLSEAELPDNIRSTVWDVVSQTQLMRSEKFDVCVELIAHFEDGRQAGFSYEELLKNFGDIKVAATLIGRSKKRNRSVIQKSFRAMGWSCLGLLATYLGLTAYFLMGRPAPSVDFVQQLNAQVLKVKKEDKAWPIYREAWLKYGFDPTLVQNLSMGSQIYVTDEEGKATTELAKPGNKDWLTATLFLKQNQPLFDAFREASKKPSLGLELFNDPSQYPLRDRRAMNPRAYDESGNLIERGDPAPENSALDDEANKLLIGVVLPHAQSFLSMARLLTSDMYLAIEAGDSDRALLNIKATFGFANQVSEYPVLVCGLTGLAVTDKGFEQIEEVMEAHPEFFSIDQLQELQLLVDNLSLRNHFKFEGERAMMYDVLQRLYTDDGNGDGRMTVTGVMMLRYIAGLTNQRWFIADSPSQYLTSTVGMPTSLFTFATRKEIADKFNEIMDRVEADFVNPIDGVPFKLDDFVTKKELAGRYRLLTAFCLKLEQLKAAMQRRLDRRDSVSQLIAAELLKRQKAE